MLVSFFEHPRNCLIPSHNFTQKLNRTSIPTLGACIKNNAPREYGWNFGETLGRNVTHLGRSIFSTKIANWLGICWFSQGSVVLRGRGYKVYERHFLGVWKCEVCHERAIRWRAQRNDQETQGGTLATFRPREKVGRSFFLHRRPLQSRRATKRNYQRFHCTIRSFA